MSRRQELLNYGFQEVKKTQDYRLLQLYINEEEDRFTTALHWYSDTPKKVYIVQSQMSGNVIISEAQVLRNHNDLHDGVLKNWKSFKESFPAIESIQ